MKLIVNSPVPTPVPPTTYDIIGLSQSDMNALRAVLNRCGSSTDPIADKALKALYRTGLFNAVVNVLGY